MQLEANAKTKYESLALVDSGANAGMAASNVWFGWDSGRIVDVSGMDNHTVNGVPIGHVVCVVESDVGPVIVNYPESAQLPTGKTIFSVTQMQEFGCNVVTKPATLNGGKHPHIESPDGY